MRRRRVAVLLSAALAGLAVGGALFAQNRSHETTTFYTPTQVRSALTRSGLKLEPVLPPSAYVIGPGPALGALVSETIRARGGVPDPSAGPLVRLPLFLVLVAMPNPRRNLDAVDARRALNNFVKGYNWQVAHYRKHFHARRANVVVYGLSGLSARFRDRLANALRSLPNHGDPTLIE